MTQIWTSFEILSSLETHVIIAFIIDSDLGRLTILCSLDLSSGGDLRWVESHQVSEDS